MDAKRYNVTYSVHYHQDGLDAADVPEGHGASDSLVLFAITYLESGAMALETGGLDGRGTPSPVPESELFKVLILMAHGLARSTELPEEYRAACEATWLNLQEATKATVERPNGGTGN